MITGLTLIIPTYNEEKVIRSTIEMTLRQLKKLNIPFELIITDDGSKDRTVEIAKSIGDVRVRVIKNVINRGRGEAVSEAILRSKNGIILFMDADMSTNLRHIEEAMKYIQEGYDVAIGSRWSSGSLAYRNHFRKFASLLYNNFIRLIFNSEIRDHECGFKAFKGEVAKSLVRKLGIQKRKERGIAWDTELLVIAQKSGYRIKEFPVKWREGKKSEIKILNHGKMVLKYIVRLWFRLYVTGYLRTSGTRRESLRNSSRRNIS